MWDTTPSESSPSLFGGQGEGEGEQGDADSDFIKAQKDSDLTQLAVLEELGCVSRTSRWRERVVKMMKTKDLKANVKRPVKCLHILLDDSLQ